MIEHKFQLTQIRKLFLIVFILSTIHYSLSTILAAPHISGKHIPGQPKDHVHKIPDVQKLRAKGLSPQAIRETIGTVGTKEIAVILVNFASAGTNTSRAEMMTPTDTTGFNTTFSVVKNFFKEVSYNQLNLEITFFYSTGTATTLSGSELPYSLSDSMSSYGEDSDSSLSKLVKDALTATGGAVSKGPYDYVMVAHAGFGNESTVKSGDIWSAFISWSGAVQNFTEGTIVPARESGSMSPIGVTCHEFGHQLGLPDLYQTVDTDGNGKLDSQVGKWCLMDMGTWAGSPVGSNPSHPSIWCKDLLGWIEPSVTNTTINGLSVSAVEVSSQGIKIPILTASDPNNEYFLLEYRSTSTAFYDKYLPGSGILIWHIDDNVGGGSSHWDFSNYNDINNNSAHRRIDLEEADNDDPSSYNGDSTDPWPGTKLTFSTPQSDAYNGSPSEVTILNFAGIGNSEMTFDVSFKPWIRGWVRDSAGKGISGVTITALNISTTTNTNGQYLMKLDSGTYTLTPSTFTSSGINYSFYPSSRTVDLVNYLDNQDFTATRRIEIVSLSGEVIPENNIFNPAKGEKTTIWYKIPEASSVKLQIYTLDGILVKTLLDDYKNAAVYYAEPWDGKNDDNETVASGIYLLYFETNGTKQVKKIAIVK